MVTRARWVLVVLVCTFILYPLGLVLRQVEEGEEVSLEEEEEDLFSVLPITADPLVVFSNCDIDVHISSHLESISQFNSNRWKNALPRRCRCPGWRCWSPLSPPAAAPPPSCRHAPPAPPSQASPGTCCPTPASSSS